MSAGILADLCKRLELVVDHGTKVESNCHRVARARGRSDLNNTGEAMDMNQQRRWVMESQD